MPANGGHIRPSEPTSIRERILVSSETDEHAAVFADIGYEAVRTGRGNGPNTTGVLASDDATFVSSLIGFPLVARATLGEDRVSVAIISAAPPGNRWCEIDVEPGTVLLYGPGAEHTATTRPGLEYTFGSFRLQALEETADRLHLNLKPPQSGLVRALAPTPEVRLLTAILGIGDDQGTSIESALDDRLDIFHAVVAAFSTEPPQRVVGAGARIDSRHIVHMCIEYADAIERIPTISEMCLVAHVSERRLRHAFTNTFDVPPLRYFKYRSLAHARRVLVNREESSCTVSEVASDVGIHNFGRFAHSYRSAYGELPSATLKASR
jgi:AraC-like DNA-binding protein